MYRGYALCHMCCVEVLDRLVLPRCCSVRLAIMQVDEIVLPHRPNYGKMGKQVVVTANHYKAEYNKNQMLYQYDVSLEGFDKTALVGQIQNVYIGRSLKATSNRHGSVELVPS